MPSRHTPTTFWARVDQRGIDECWLWRLARDEYGYGRVRYHQREWHAHRLAWALVHGDPGTNCVCHHCDNPPCCNPAHLFRGTHTDNMQDSTRKGRHPRNATSYLPEGAAHHFNAQPETRLCGERNGQHVLTEDEVRAVLQRYVAGESAYRLAEAYGVVKGTIQFIVSGQTWQHVPREDARVPRAGATRYDATTIAALRTMFAMGSVTQVELARRFRISTSQVNRILRGRSRR